MTHHVSERRGSSPQPRPPVTSGKLIKRFLLGLDEGLYLVSGVCDGTTRETATPAFVETVAPPEEREAQWQRIKAAFVDGRQCDLFEGPQHHSEWKRYWNLPVG